MAAQSQDALPYLPPRGGGIAYPYGAYIFSIGTGGDLQPGGRVVIGGVQARPQGAVHPFSHLFRGIGIVLGKRRPAVGIALLNGGIHRNKVGILGGAPDALGRGGHAAADGKIGTVGVLAIIINCLAQHLFHTGPYPVAGLHTAKAQSGRTAQIVIVILDVAVGGHRHGLSGFPLGAVAHLILHHAAQNLIGIANYRGTAVNDTKLTVIGGIIAAVIRLRFRGGGRRGRRFRLRLRGWLRGWSRSRRRFRGLYGAAVAGVPGITRTIGFTGGVIPVVIAGITVFVVPGLPGGVLRFRIGFIPGFIISLTFGLGVRLFRLLLPGLTVILGGFLILLRQHLILRDMLPIRQQGLSALHCGIDGQVLGAGGGAAAGSQQQKGSSGGQRAAGFQRYRHEDPSFRAVFCNNLSLLYRIESVLSTGRI